MAASHSSRILRYAGPAVIVAMFAVSIALAGFAWWWNVQQGDRALAFWGRDAAVLIRYAPQVELLRLSDESAGEGDEALCIDGRPWHVTESKDITAAPGLLNARHSLVRDASFDWDAAPPGAAATWQFALRFTDGDDQATILFDFPRARTRRLGSDEEASIDPIAEAMKGFLERQLDEDDKVNDGRLSNPHEPRGAMSARNLLDEGSTTR